MNTPRVGRNAQCTCGSGRKRKHCCLLRSRWLSNSSPSWPGGLPTLGPSRSRWKQVVFDAPLDNGGRLHAVLLYSDAELRLNHLDCGERVSLHLPDIDFRGPATVVRIEGSAVTGEAEAQVLRVVRFRNDDDLGTALHGDWTPPDELVKRWRTRRRQIVLKLDYPDGGWCDIRLLRTVDWIAQSGVEVGGVMFLSLVDVGIRGWARVLEILPCGPVETGRGGRVSGTFRHSSTEVYDLKLESETKPIGVTGTHPFWSCDRNAWVSAIDLRIGERLKTLTGTTVVETMTKRADREPVYNIEVEGEHVYRVGESGVLVHNASAPAQDQCDTPDWQSLHSIAESRRKELARSPALSPGKREFGVAPGRTTIAAAVLILNGQIVKVLKAFSGTANCNGLEEFIPNDQRQLKCRSVQGNLRDTDAEAKILESVLKVTKEPDMGCVLIYVDGPKDVCGSCRDVIADFESKRPCIPVITKWRGGASTADEWSLP